MIIVCIAIVIIIMYFCSTKCRHTRTIFKYCFPFLPISHIVHMSRRTDLFVEVTNITKGNRIWAHFVSTGCFPTQIQLSRLIQKDDVQVETICCICRATTRPPRPSSTAECLCLIACLREEQASAASWEPRPPFEAAEMD